MKMNSVSSLAGLSLSLALFAAPAHADVRSALADYTRTAHGIVSELQTLSNSASSCGFVGTIMASRMQSSLAKEQEQIATVTQAAAQGPAGRAAIQQKMQEMERGNQELRSSSGMIKRGLANGDATCQRAEASFDRMSALSYALPPKMAKIIQAL